MDFLLELQEMGIDLKYVFFIVIGSKQYNKRYIVQAADLLAYLIGEEKEIDDVDLPAVMQYHSHVVSGWS